MNKKTHLEHSERILGKNPQSPCTCWTVTFGGRCLNCGYDPYDPEEPERKEEEEET